VVARRECHAIALKTDNRSEAQVRDPNWHLISSRRPTDHTLEERFAFLTRNLTALEKRIPMLGAQDQYADV
jgi:hypothetical protein